MSDTHGSGWRDYFLEVPRGNIPEHSSVNKFGGNLVITNNTTEDVWDGGGTYSFPTSATITHIRAAADSATTQGSTIEVQGLDANWDLVVQTKDLDGTNSTTEVALDTALIRVFRMKVLENAVMDEDVWAGDDDFAVGDAKAIITAGNNQTLMAIYTVPNGKTAYMTNYYCDFVPTASKQPDSVGFKLLAADRDNGYEFQLKNRRGIAKGGPGFIHPFKPFEKFTQKTDIKITASCSGGAGDDADVNAGFDLVLINET